MTKYGEVFYGDSDKTCSDPISYSYESYDEVCSRYFPGMPVTISSKCTGPTSKFTAPPTPSQPSKVPTAAPTGLNTGYIIQTSYSQSRCPPSGTSATSATSANLMLTQYVYPLGTCITSWGSPYMYTNAAPTSMGYMTVAVKHFHDLLCTNYSYTSTNYFSTTCSYGYAYSYAPTFTRPSDKGVLIT